MEGPSDLVPAPARRKAHRAPIVAVACVAGFVALVGAAGAQDTPVPVRAIDVYRTDAFDADWVESELGDDIRAVLRGTGEPEELEAAADRVRATLRARGEFAWLELSPIQYFGEEGPYMYVTVDVVDAADVDERMVFDAPPTGEFDDPGGLVTAWREYEAAVFRLLQAGEVGAVETDGCPAFHCLPPAFAHPDLERFADVFESGVPEHRAALARILEEDADPGKRAAAAFLLAHGRDGSALVELLVEAIRDPHTTVRNNAMRVLAAMAQSGTPGATIPLEPILRAIDFPATTDRNKALAILAGIARNRPETAGRIADESGETLLRLLRLRQPNNHDFAWQVLRAISGEEHGERDHAAWEGWLRRHRESAG